MKNPTPDEIRSFLGHVEETRVRHARISNPFVAPDGVAESEWPISPSRAVKYPQLTADMVPDVIWRYASDQAELLGISPDAIAMPAIVSCAAALCDKIRIQPKRHDTGWLESARLWAAMVGDPSARKTPALSSALRPLRAIDFSMSEENARKMDEYNHRAFDEKKKKPAERERMVKPAMKRLIVQDSTIEALGEALKDNPKGVLCVHDELAGWIGSFDAYSGTSSAANRDRGYWLQAYNGGQMVIDRIARGVTIIPNFSVSIIGGIQPAVLNAVAKEMGSDGLLQRFMIFRVSNTGKEQDRVPDKHISDEYRNLISSIHAINSGFDGSVVLLSDEAHAVRERINNKIQDLMDFDELALSLRGHFGKWTGLFARLLLVFHVCECVGNKVFPTTVKVSKGTAERVEALMMRFLRPNAIGFYDEISGSEYGDFIVKTCGWILMEPREKITKRDMMQNFKAWRSMPMSERDSVINTLIDCGWIYPIDGAVSAKAKGWVVNPAVYGRFDDIRDQEIRRRQKSRAYYATLDAIN